MSAMGASPSRTASMEVPEEAPRHALVDQLESTARALRASLGSGAGASRRWLERLLRARASARAAEAEGRARRANFFWTEAMSDLGRLDRASRGKRESSGSAPGTDPLESFARDVM